MNHIGTSMPYTDTTYGSALVGMPSMHSMSSDPNAYGDALPPMSAQSLSARTSRSNSLIRPGSGVDDNRRSLSALELGNGRVNFNGGDFRAPNGLGSNLSHELSPYGSQQSHTPVSASGAPNAYSYDHGVSQPDMTQTGISGKGEDTNHSTPYGRPTLPNVENLSNAQDNPLRWNGSFNGDAQDNFLMTSSMASGPNPGNIGGVLTVKNF